MELDLGDDWESSFDYCAGGEQYLFLKKQVIGEKRRLYANVQNETAQNELMRALNKEEFALSIKRFDSLFETGRKLILDDLSNEDDWKRNDTQVQTKLWLESLSSVLYRVATLFGMTGSPGTEMTSSDDYLQMQQLWLEHRRYYLPPRLAMAPLSLEETKRRMHILIPIEAIFQEMVENKVYFGRFYELVQVYGPYPLF